MKDLLEAPIEGRDDPRLRHPPVRHLQADLQVALHPIEGADDEAASRRHRRRTGRSVGGTTQWSDTAFLRSRSGVAALESEARATNQALGMSVGQPDRDAGDGGGLGEGVARLLELGRGAVDAGIAAARAGAQAVPEPGVAVRMGLGAETAQMLHEATQIRRARALALYS